MLVAVSDAGFFDTFKEASALANHISAAHEKNDDALVREIANIHHNPFGITSSPSEVEQGTVTSLQAAVAALQAKSPESLEAYKALVLDVANRSPRRPAGSSRVRRRRSGRSPQLSAAHRRHLPRHPHRQAPDASSAQAVKTTARVRGRGCPFP